MKLITTLFALIVSLSLEAQNAFKVKDEISYFNGVDWIDSEIIQVGEKGKYLVYSNKSKTKTIWSSSEDIEAIVVPNFFPEVRVDYTEIRRVPVIEINDTVYISVSGMNAYEAIVAGKNEEKGEYLIYSDSTRLNTQWVSDKHTVLKTSKADPPYKETKTVITNYFKVGETVKYKKGDEWFVGIIEYTNDSSQLFINKEWFDADNIAKLE